MDIDACSACGGARIIVNKKYFLCQECNWQRLHPNEQKKRYELKRTPIKQKAYKINQVSKSESKRQSEYSVVSKKFKKDNPVCQVRGCDNPTTDVHHKKGKIGTLLCDVRHFLASCRGCHSMIEENPVWAKEQGYSEDRLGK